MTDISLRPLKMMILVSLFLYELGYIIDGFYTFLLSLPPNEAVGMIIMLGGIFTFVDTVIYYFLGYLFHLSFQTSTNPQSDFLNWSQYSKFFKERIEDHIKEYGGILYTGNIWIERTSYPYKEEERI